MVPKFTCTEEALEFGRHCPQEQCQELQAARKKLLQSVYNAREQGDYNTALDYAWQAQFCREAFETTKKEVR